MIDVVLTDELWRGFPYVARNTFSLDEPRTLGAEPRREHAMAGRRPRGR